MQPAASSTAAAAATVGFHRWNSPIPYLFGGLALMLALIAVALVILACSYRRAASNSSNQDEEKQMKPVHVLEPEMEPKIVVILAGYEVPTCLAKPLPRAQ